jgi:NAD(P)-dependent dehydrogenase (short-subunit alcohol dehydrogenase family)
MLLQNKNAIIYGAGGSLGSAVARALAQAGANVFLTGRTAGRLQKVASEIIATGGKAEIATVDALNEKEIQAYLDKLTDAGTTIDISFCAIDFQSVQDIALTEMKADDYMRPITIALQSQFLTSTAAARKMIKQKSGVILSLTATPGGIGYPYTGGFASACVAMETFVTNLASEVGAYGVRAVNIRSAGSPDSQVFKQAIEAVPQEMEHVLQSMKNDTMLKKLPMMADIAQVAVFLSSDLASLITGVTIDVTGGTTTGLNYRAPKIKEAHATGAPLVTSR